jgi:1,4-dihydroxy-2-naphthoate octaprenyltransferase
VKNLNASNISAKDLVNQNRAVRAMIILAILLCAASIACGVVVMFVLKQHKILYFVAGGLSIAAGTFYQMLG